MVLSNVDTYAQANLDDRPKDEVFAVRVFFEVRNAEYSDDLNNSDKETESKKTCQHNLLLVSTVRAVIDYF
jgi:hypothetical protein